MVNEKWTQIIILSVMNIVQGSKQYILTRLKDHEIRYIFMF